MTFRVTPVTFQSYTCNFSAKVTKVTAPLLREDLRETNCNSRKEELQPLRLMAVCNSKKEAVNVQG
jgi:hypothetical protein